MNNLRRHKNEQFSVVLLQALTLKYLAQKGYVAQSWNFLQCFRHTVVHQAGNNKTLSIPQLHL